MRGGTGAVFCDRRAVSLSAAKSGVCVCHRCLSCRESKLSAGTLGNIRLPTNEVSKVKGWVIYISKNVIGN